MMSALKIVSVTHVAKRVLLPSGMFADMLLIGSLKWES